MLHVLNGSKFATPPPHPALQQADWSRTGIFGHSMGGENTCLAAAAAQAWSASSACRTPRSKAAASMRPSRGEASTSARRRSRPSRTRPTSPTGPPRSSGARTPSPRTPPFRPGKSSVQRVRQGVCDGASTARAFAMAVASELCELHNVQGVRAYSGRASGLLLSATASAQARPGARAPATSAAGAKARALPTVYVTVTVLNRAEKLAEMEGAPPALIVRGDAAIAAR